MIRNLQDLPENHIFRLVYREYRPDEEDHNAQWSDLNRTIDIDAIIARLETPEGQAETKDWIETPLFERRLFIHQLCDCDFSSNNDGWFLKVDAESGFAAIKLAVEAYPESIRLGDSKGQLPLHIICDRSVELLGGSIATGMWYTGYKEIFHFLLMKFPESALATTRCNKTPLACVLGSIHTANPAASNDRDSIIMILLEHYPSAVKIPDSDGRYPLHVATDGQSCKFSIIKKMIQIYPQALEMGDSEGKTPLQCYLRCCTWGLNSKNMKLIELMLTASPYCAFVEDKSILMEWQGLDPSGDALDYALVKFCENVRFGINRDKLNIIDDALYPGDCPENCAGGFALASENYLQESSKNGYQLYFSDHSAENGERSFQLALKIGHLMDGTPHRNNHLHTFCGSRRCRPWYPVIIHQIIKRYPNEASERDDRNNLPLHLFLESCMIEKDRSIRQGYIADDKEYYMAIKMCFKLILDANPSAAWSVNGDGFYPLHLAIEHCNQLDYEDIIQPLIRLAPDTMLVKKIHACQKFALYPFAQALVGDAANINVGFNLLRKDPSVISN